MSRCSWRRRAASIVIFIAPFGVARFALATDVVPDTAATFVHGDLATSISERAFAAMVRHRLLPALRDSLTHTLAGLVGQKVEALLVHQTQAAVAAAPNGSAVAAPLRDTHDAKFEAVHFDPYTVDLRVELAGPHEVRLTATSGPIGFDLSAEVCYGNCLLGCCVSSRTRFTVRMSDVRVAMSVTPEQLLDGVGPNDRIAPPVVEAAGLVVDFGTPHLGGVVGWLSGMSLVAEFLNLFGAPGAILDAVARDPLAAALEPSLEETVSGEIGGLEFAGLQDLDVALPLSATSALQLDLRFPAPPQIRTGSAIALGIETLFAPRGIVSKTKVEATRMRSGAPGLGFELAATDPTPADVTIAASDDALNQMLAVFVAEGWMRARFSGLTLNDLAPGASFPALRIGPESPILMAIDAARDSLGATLSPVLDITDDTTTADALEFTLRAPVAVRAILERDAEIPPDSALVPCSIENSGVGSPPCLLYETDVDLGLWARVRLETSAAGSALDFEVTAVQELGHRTASDSVETAVRWDDETLVLATSDDTAELAMVLQVLNATIPPVVLPASALSLGDGLGVTNLRLFSHPTSSDPAGEDYVGFLADLEIAPFEPPAQIASGSQTAPLAAAILQPEVASATATTTASLSPSIAAPSRHPLRVPTIRTGMPSESRWSLTICDASGRTVRRLHGAGGPGFLEIQWDGRGDDGRPVASGDYVYHFATAGYEESRKMSLNE
jgi:hypothetical protein